jgi:hypothetical protein
VGQGSKGALLVKNEHEFNNTFVNDGSILIMENLPGNEYTVDCFTDRHGDLLFCQPRERIRILNGISVNSKAVEIPEVFEIAKEINGKMSFRGVWFFQLKKK